MVCHSRGFSHVPSSFPPQASQYKTYQRINSLELTFLVSNLHLAVMHLVVDAIARHGETVCCVQHKLLEPLGVGLTPSRLTALLFLP